MFTINENQGSQFGGFGISAGTVAAPVTAGTPVVPASQQAATKEDLDKALATMEAQIQALQAQVAGHAVAPGTRLVRDHLGHDNALATVDKLDKVKTIEDARKIGYDMIDAALKNAADMKKWEGEASKMYHFTQSEVVWGGVGIALATTAIAAGTGYLCYKAGRERGHAEMIDTKVTFDIDGRSGSYHGPASDLMDNGFQSND